MPKVIYEMSGSADGYVVGPDGKFGWAMPDEELHRFHNDQVRALAGHLLGRRLYETMLYWETAEQDPEEIAREFALIWQALPKVVFSRTLDSVEGANTRLARDDLRAELSSLQESVGGDVAVGGPGRRPPGGRPGPGHRLRRLQRTRAVGGGTPCLALIDEYGLLVHPVAVGGGIPCLARDPGVDMERVETRRFSSRVVYLRYRAAGTR